MTTADRIRAYMRCRGIKQCKTAEDAGMTESRLSHCLTNKSPLKVEEYFAICRSLGVGADFFVEEGKWKDSVLGTAG